jgi:hypothetical protein
MVTSPMNAKIPQALKNGIRRRLNCINSIMVENDALGQLKPVPATLTYQYMLWNGFSQRERVMETYARVMMNVPKFNAIIGTITQ